MLGGSLSEQPSQEWSSKKEVRDARENFIRALTDKFGSNLAIGTLVSSHTILQVYRSDSEAKRVGGASHL